MADAREIIATAIRDGRKQELPADAVVLLIDCRLADAGYAIIPAAQEQTVTKPRKFRLGDRVTKTKGSSWTGRVVGFYSTSLTPIGYAIESENEPGSVQLYPEAALAYADIREGFDPSSAAEVDE